MQFSVLGIVIQCMWLLLHGIGSDDGFINDNPDTGLMENNPVAVEADAGLIDDNLDAADDDAGLIEDNPDAKDAVTYQTGHSLRLVHVLYRHGDRSPTHNYTNDIYQEFEWPQGYGQLSTVGMQQEYDLGTYFRQVYLETGFLSFDYNRSELYVRSTSYDRALMSAYSVLAGFFPPVKNQSIWNPKISWQPVPVHTVPIEEDFLLLTGSPCPVYEQAKIKSPENDLLQNKTMEEFRDFYSYVSEHSGEPNTWTGIGTILDPIFCQHVSSYNTPPEWVTSDIMDQIVQLRDIYNIVQSSPQQFAYLKGGKLLSEMVKHMLNKSSEDTTTPEKLFMYSAHDSTVVQFLSTLGVFNDRQPPYTACVIVELHERQHGQFAVQISYKNDSGVEPYVLTLPNCDSLCPLEHFVEIMKSSMPDDFNIACGLKNMQNGNSDVSAIVVMILLCMTVILVIIIAIMCYVKRDSLANSHDYMLVPLEMR